MLCVFCRRVATVTCNDVFCRRVACVWGMIGGMSDEVVRRCGEPLPLLTDGILGKLTVAGLQRFLRAEGVYAGVISGDFDEVTVCALQVFVNEGGWYL